MPLPKQSVQFVFGATDEDTSKKSVRLGGLISAKNTQQIHTGEHVKRGGFVQYDQIYDSPSTVTAESITSPDGAQVLIRDSATDTVFARGTDSTHNIAKGSTPRLMVKWPIRFPALATGDQAAPMPKQAGDFYVYLPDEQHFVVAKRSSDSETLLDTTTFAASAGSPASTHVKSFAVIDNATFDASNLWIFWIDWSSAASIGNQHNRDAIRAVKVSHDLVTVTQYTVDTGTTTNKMCTSICASVTDDGYVTVGCTTAHAVTTPDDYTAFWDFRKDGPPNHTGIKVNKYDATPSLKFSTESERTTIQAGWTASGICALTSAGAYTLHSGFCSFAFWASNTSALTSSDLLLATVNESTGEITYVTIDTVTDAGHVLASGFSGRTLFMGSVTGHETQHGAFIAAQMRIYYRTSGGGFEDPSGDYGLYPDQLFTKAYSYDSRGAPYGVAVEWTARGAWLASGWFMSNGGIPLVITGWEDNDKIQMPYHLRRFDTGAIVAQFAYGEAAYPGGTATTDAQIEGHICDLNQPMSAIDPTEFEAEKGLVLALTSAAVDGSVDIANVTLDTPQFSNPSIFRSFALIPGPIPTIASGWQNIAEAGPLVYPSGLRACWGEGSS